MIVAIDGPAGSGKSTVARAVARDLGIVYLDTGAMYRCVALAALRQGVSPEDGPAVERVARSCSIELGRDAEGAQLVLLDGRDVTAEIRSAEVDAAVSAASAHAPVRALMVAMQRGLAEGRDVVAEGRDIGTAVFPQAEVKVFLTAADTARARRRAEQNRERARAAGLVDEGPAEAEVLAGIRARDAADSTRAASPLAAAPDAVRVDSTDMAVEDVVALVEGLVAKARQGAGERGGR